MICNVSIRRWVVLLSICTGVVSSYSEGLPGEYLVSQQWRDALSANSPLTNPAYLTKANYISVQFAQALTMANTFQISEGVFVLPFRKTQSFALSYAGLGAGDLDGSHFDDITGQRVADGKKLSERSNTVVLSYAIKVWKGLSVGVNAEVLYNSIFGQTSINYGGDFGISYAVIDDSTFGTHIIGVSTHSLVLQGDTKYASAATISYLGYFWNNQIETELDLNLKDFLAQSENFISGNDQSFETEVAFKAGFWLFKILKLYGHIGTEYYGFSAGVNTPSINKGRDLAIVYQYIMPFEGVYPSHTFFARAEFGDPRKEKAAKAEKQKISGIPYDLYNKAMQLYYDGKYWDAFFVFNKILVEYPRFIKNDWISYYSGNCLEKLDIRNVAAAQYQRSMIKYPKSKIHPLSNMGIMNIYYRQENTSGVTDQFNILSGPHTVDSIRYHAHYLMGETFYREKAYDKALDVLSRIPETHSDYIYARHTMAVASVMRDNYDMALTYLKDCLSAKTASKTDEELTSRTYLFTGYLFHEAKEFANAMASLSMVPKSSYYYEDALLGIAWIALRAQKWEECTIAAQNLVSTSTSVVNSAEGELLEAYVHMMHKEYDQASNLLQNASARMSGLQPPSQDSLSEAKETYNTIRSDYETFGKSVEEVASQKQVSDTIEKIDSLFIDQKEFKRNIDEKVKFIDNFNRQCYFARNINIVREDVEYALARCLKTLSQKDMIKTQEKAEKKTQKLDKEIEELKQQIEKTK